MANEKFDKALIFIEKYSISQKPIADLLGISIPSVNQKLRGINYQKFNEEQKKLIIKYLRDLKNELSFLN